MNEEATWELISTERLRLADELDGLSGEQWAVQSQCEHWTVREVAAHLVTPFETSTVGFLSAMALSRFNFDRAIRRMTARVNNRNSVEQIIAKLRANHDNRWTPPGEGVDLLLAEVLVHGQDIRRVLGLGHDIPDQTIAAALDGVADPTTRADYAARIGVPATH
jgi:uncharacterized protein (TIGR03083 family)